MHYNYLLAIQDLQPNKGTDKANSIRQVVWKIRARKVVLATGSIERFLTFDNNDRPGIMLANSVRKYFNYYKVKPRGNIIIFTNNDSAYKTAIDFYLNKIPIKAIVDVRKESNGDLVRKAKNFGLKIYFNHGVINTKGRKKITV